MHSICKSTAKIIIFMKNYNAVKRNCKIYDYLTLGYKNKFRALRKVPWNTHIIKRLYQFLEPIIHLHGKIANQICCGFTILRNVVISAYMRLHMFGFMDNRIDELSLACGKAYWYNAHSFIVICCCKSWIILTQVNIVANIYCPIAVNVNRLT